MTKLYLSCDWALQPDCSEMQIEMQLYLLNCDVAVATKLWLSCSYDSLSQFSRCSSVNDIDRTASAKQWLGCCTVTELQLSHHDWAAVVKLTELQSSVKPCQSCSCQTVTELHEVKIWQRNKYWMATELIYTAVELQLCCKWAAAELQLSCSTAWEVLQLSRWALSVELWLSCS